MLSNANTNSGSLTMHTAGRRYREEDQQQCAGSAVNFTSVLAEISAMKGRTRTLRLQASAVPFDLFTALIEGS